MGPFYEPVPTGLSCISMLSSNRPLLKSTSSLTLGGGLAHGWPAFVTGNGAGRIDCAVLYETRLTRALNKIEV